MSLTKDRTKSVSSLNFISDFDPIGKEPSEKSKELWQRAYKKIRTKMRIRKLLMGARQEPELYYDEKQQKYVSRKSINPDFVEVKTQGSRFILTPQGIYYTIWLGFVSILLLYLAIGDSFISAFLDLDNDPDLGRLDIIIDLVFIIDFCLTLNLAYYDEDGGLVYDRKKIFTNYAKSWMIVDLSSSIPFGLIEAVSGTSKGSSNLIRLIRLRNIPKLFRLAKLMKMLTNFSMFEDLDYYLSKYNKEIRFFKVILMVCICIHITSCLFYLAAKVDNFGPETWVYRHSITNFSTEEKYLTSVYWAITTLGTIGYGDLVPRTVNEKLLAMIWMVIGVYVVSYSVGSLTSFYSDINIKENLKHERIIMAEDFSKKTGISKQVLHKFKRTIKFMDIPTNKVEDEKMFQGIPLSLKIQISQNIHDRAIKKLPFFDDKDAIFIADISLRLSFRSGNSEEVIWIEKESADGIYFIIEGRVRLSYFGTVFNVLQKGFYFGDIEIVNGTERFFKVESSDAYKFLRMDLDVINRIKEIYPLIWRELKENSKRRLRNQIQNLSEMLLIKRLNNTGSINGLNLSEFKTDLDEMFEKLYLEAQNPEKKDFKLKMKNRLENTSKSISRISDMVDIIFK